MRLRRTVAIAGRFSRKGAVPRRRGLQVVRVVGECLAPVFGDQQQVLETNAADVLQAVDPRLDRDDVSRYERFTTGEPEDGWLVHLEPDAMSQAEANPRVSVWPGVLVRCVGWPARSMISAATS